MDRTLVICKPDAVERAWSARSSPASSQGPAPRRRRAAHHRRRRPPAATTPSTRASRSTTTWWPSSPGGPALLLVVEGPEDTSTVVRTLMGATNPAEAAPGTIRGDLGIELTENLVHGSRLAPSRRPAEIALFFPSLSRGCVLVRRRRASGASRLGAPDLGHRRRRPPHVRQTLLLHVPGPRHGGRPGHGQHPRLRARAGHRPERAVGRGGQRPGRPAAGRRPRGQAHDRAHARATSRPSARSRTA